MGRQTAIVATELDERDFLAFVRTSAEIRIFQSTAAEAAEVWVDEFAPYDGDHRTYYLWNPAFPWKPVIRRTEDRQQVVVWNLDTAPALEFTRTDIAWLFRPGNKLLVADGRLYWDNHPLGAKVGYDVQEFSRWYDHVMRWVRKQGRREPAISGAYLLPDAWRRWQAIRAARRAKR